MAFPLFAQDAPPSAERLPLASKSLLLDITRTPEGRLVAVGERGHVVLSANGSEWDQAQEVPTRATLTSVAAAGNTLWAAGHDTTILHSEDGGQTWTLQYHDPGRQQPVMDIYFTDEQNGFALGAYGLMLTTTDGGTTWEDQMVTEDEWHLNSLVDLGGGQMVIAGEAGYSYFSTDGGASWTTVEMPYQGSMFGAVQAGACVLTFGLRGHVQRSCDDGVAWEELITPTEASLAGGAYGNGQTVLAGNSGQILVIQEDGTLKSMLHPSGVDFAGVLSLDNDTWLLVGDEGIHVFEGEGGN